MAGQLSPDGAWYWDGVAWQPAASPDGRWRWSGSAWLPAAPSTTAPTWARPYASAATRARILQLSFAALSTGYLAEITGDLLALAGLKGAGDRTGVADVVQFAAALLVLAAFISTVVLFCMWIHRVYRNLPALGAVGLHHSPRWAVGWWFIPIANLWKPYQVIREIWQHMDPDRLGWDLLKIWWAVWLLSNYFGNLVSRLQLPESAADGVDLVSTLFNLAAAALALLVVRQITAWQVQRAAAAG